MKGTPILWGIVHYSPNKKKEDLAYKQGKTLRSFLPMVYPSYSTSSKCSISASSNWGKQVLFLFHNWLIKHYVSKPEEPKRSYGRGKTEKKTYLAWRNKGGTYHVDIARRIQNTMEENLLFALSASKNETSSGLVLLIYFFFLCKLYLLISIQYSNQSLRFLVLLVPCWTLNIVMDKV